MGARRAGRAGSQRGRAFHASLLAVYGPVFENRSVGPCMAIGVAITNAESIYMGIRGPRTLPTGARLQGTFVWNGRAKTRSSGCAPSMRTASAASPHAPARLRTSGMRSARSPIQQIVQLVLQAQRDALLRMRTERKLSDDVMLRILARARLGGVPA